MPDLLRLALERVDTPVGELAVVTDRDGILRALDWVLAEKRLRDRLRRHYGDDGFTVDESASARTVALRVSEALRAYFDGAFHAIEEVPVRTGGTTFQRAVWAALREIPCGATASYSDIARRVGRPLAVRAVGLANNANPIGIVVPCHRVVGKDGSLTGYGGGIENKRWLLAHEAAERRGG